MAFNLDFSNWSIPTTAEIQNFTNKASTLIADISTSAGRLAASAGAAQTYAQTGAAVETQTARDKQRAAVDKLPVFGGLTMVEIIVGAAVIFFIAQG